MFSESLRMPGLPQGTAAFCEQELLTITQQRRQLVADRLAGACRHHHQRITASHYGINDVVFF